MANSDTKEDISREINELLFGQEEVVDFSKMTKMDLGILKNQLESDQALFIAARLADNRGVGRGKLLKMAVGEQNAQELLQGEGGDNPLAGLLGGGEGQENADDRE